MNAGGLQTEEGREGPADGNASEKPRHDLVEFDFSALENGVAEKHQGFQQKQHGRMGGAIIIPLHRKDCGDDAQGHHPAFFHAADTTLEFHGPDTRQKMQCDQHRKWRCGQDHIEKHRDTHHGHQNP